MVSTNRTQSKKASSCDESLVNGSHSGIILKTTRFLSGGRKINRTIEMDAEPSR